ncbi:MAG: acetyl-coenzyme A synthetase N-terminal domain-containing protein, partial [Bacillota bacterium]|nr:acetyl-coenzyme A synthetase N-terminal domain-containing protein [Bacillota bacterium]
MRKATIDTLLQEDRIFHPDSEFTRQANVRHREIYAEARSNSRIFWAMQAERLEWFQKWDQVVDWQPPFV